MNFETYLISKKIDAQAFREAEPSLWESWKIEFEQLHPNSFTAQKLYLINPIRRKYTLKTEDKPVSKPAPPVAPIRAVKALNVEPVQTETPGVPVAQTNPAETGQPPTEQAPPTSEEQNPKPVTPKPAVPRPVFKPKPKTN